MFRLPLHHWRGALRLSVSLWLGLVAAVMPPAIIVLVLRRHGADIRAPWAMLATLLAFDILTLLCLAWYATGTWRAARGRGIPGYLARGFVALLFLVITTVIAVSAWVTLPEAWAACQDDPSWPPTTITTHAQGRVIAIDGPLRWSATTRLATALRENPQARLVRLSGPGGRVTTGLELHDIIRAHRLETLVTADCASACTDAFLAGTTRWIGPDAHLGFHQGSIAGSTTSSIDMATLRIYQAAGLSPGFINRVLTGGTGLWVPTHDELLAARVATARATPGAWPLD